MDWRWLLSERFRNVIITGDPEIGEGVSIGDYSEVNGKGARVVIGAHSDIASFVAINAADSSDRCIERSGEIKRRDITIGEHVFIGSHCFIGGGVSIGHHSKVAAGTVISRPLHVPPFSVVRMGTRTYIFADRNRPEESRFEAVVLPLKVPA